MTEQEAKTKWCPMVRTGLVAGMAVNRHVADAPSAIDGVYDETRCIAGACMMWRWTPATPTKNLQGYCGIAGPVQVVHETVKVAKVA